MAVTPGHFLCCVADALSKATAVCIAPSMYHIGAFRLLPHRVIVGRVRCVFRLGLDHV